MSHPWRSGSFVDGEYHLSSIADPVSRSYGRRSQEFLKGSVSAARRTRRPSAPGASELVSRRLELVGSTKHDGRAGTGFPRPKPGVKVPEDALVVITGRHLPARTLG